MGPPVRALPHDTRRRNVPGSATKRPAVDAITTPATEEGKSYAPLPSYHANGPRAAYAGAVGRAVASSAGMRQSDEAYPSALTGSTAGVPRSWPASMTRADSVRRPIDPGVCPTPRGPSLRCRRSGWLSGCPRGAIRSGNRRREPMQCHHTTQTADRASYAGAVGRAVAWYQCHAIPRCRPQPP